MEKNGISHQPKYFERWSDPPSTGNPNIKQTQNDSIQYRYNGLYFEKDRKNKDWSRLPDLFSDKLPEGIDGSENVPVNEDEDEKHIEYNAEDHQKITSAD